MKRLLWLGLVLFFYVICSGCGETFRPIVIPNPPVFPNPQAAHSVMTLNDNVNASGTVVAGTAMVIDVSGDSEMSTANVGIRPVHAVQQNASQVLVVNQSVSDTPADSITKLNFNGSTIASTSTISLPASYDPTSSYSPSTSAPNFIAIAPSDTYAYVTLPNYQPNATSGNVTPSIGVININTNSVVETVTVGSNPYALAVTPDRSKLYVANQGDGIHGTINAFTIVNTGSIVNLTPRTLTQQPSKAPIWLVARTDSQRVYVLEANGTLASIDTTLTAGPDTLTEYSAITVPGAVKMTYDSNLIRLYISGLNQVAIVDVSQAAPTAMATLTIPSTTPANCAAIGAATLNTLDVAALPDGSRAYAGSYYEDANGNICPQVTVIDAKSNTLKSTTPIAVPGFAAYDAFCSTTTTRFRIMMAAAGDSTRAYLSSCDGGNVNFIDTSTDTYIQDLAAPTSLRSGNPPQNPVFLIAGP
jgi:DNA-binding beta-propeller fold protein YncE